MKIKSLIAVSSVLLLFTVSCKKENMCDCLKGTGKTITETRSVSDFTLVELYDNIDLVITQDSVNKLTVEGGEKLLPSIETKFENNKLIIKNNNRCNWVRSYKNKLTVYLSAKNLNCIEFFGCGNVTSTNTICTDTMTIEFKNNSGKVDIKVNSKESYYKMHTGAGDLYVSGTTDFNYFYSTSNGFAHLENLHSNTCSVTNGGTGDCYVNVDNELDARINYIGNVYYYGNPTTIKTDITDKGQLIKLN